MSDIDEIKAKYTYIAPQGGQWATFFHVGVQSFCVGENTNKRRAKWFASILAKALEALIKEECHE